jgi:hypothetical protein
VCVVHGAFLRLAGQKAAILCALEPTRFTYVHFVLESAYLKTAQKGSFQSNKRSFEATSSQFQA